MRLKYSCFGILILLSLTFVRFDGPALVGRVINSPNLMSESIKNLSNGTINALRRGFDRRNLMPSEFQILESIFKKYDPIASRVSRNGRGLAAVVWEEKIHPRVKNEWEFRPTEVNQFQRSILDDICSREEFRSSMQEDLPKNVLALGLNDGNAELLADALFLANLLDPSLIQRDTLCLMRDKVGEQALKLMAPTWGEYASIGACLNSLRERVPPASDCA